MPGLDALEVLIGLAFVYWLLSLIVSQLTELIARLLALRAATLYQGITQLVSDPALPGLVNEIYRHRLIAGFSPINKGANEKPTIRQGIRRRLAGADGRGKPSYIAAASFRRALIASLPKASLPAAAANAAADAIKAEQAQALENSAPSGALAHAAAALKGIADAVRTALGKADPAPEGAQGGSNDVNAAQAKPTTVLDAVHHAQAMQRIALAQPAESWIAIAEAVRSAQRQAKVASAAAQSTGNDPLKVAHKELESALEAWQKLASSAAAAWSKESGQAVPQLPIRQVIEDLPVPGVRDALLALIADAGNDEAKMAQSIEKWYDDAMDRVSGWYKRKAQLITIIVGAILVVACNVDTVAIANTLWTDSTMRTTVANFATQIVQATPTSAPTATAKATPAPQLSAPTAASGTGATAGAGATAPAVAPAPPTSTPSSDLAPLKKELKDLNQLQQLQLPLGWPPPTTTSTPSSSTVFVTGLGDVLVFYASQLNPGKIIGLLFTIIAVSLGAPFWFDTLNNLVNLRAAGDAPPATNRQGTPA